MGLLDCFPLHLGMEDVFKKEKQGFFVFIHFCE